MLGFDRTAADGTRLDIPAGTAPRMDVDAETYAVRADGELLVCDPVDVLPLAQRDLPF